MYDRGVEFRVSPWTKYFGVRCDVIITYYLSPKLTIFGQPHILLQFIFIHQTDKVIIVLIQISQLLFRLILMMNFMKFQYWILILDQHTINNSL